MLFGRKKTKELIIEKINYLKELFSGEILKNPNSGEYSIDGYRSFCYKRCSDYQEEIQKVKQEIEAILSEKDDSVSIEDVVMIREFVEKVVTGAKEAADKFYSILEEKEHGSEQEKGEANNACYNFSLIARKNFGNLIDSFLLNFN